MSLTHKEMQHTLMERLRLYHFPVAVTFLRNEDAIAGFCEQAEVFAPSSPLTFCQAETAARMQGKTVLMRPGNMSCRMASIAFGWQEFEEKDVEMQRKRYTRTLEQARHVLADRPKLPKGFLAAAAVGPLGEATIEPSVVHFYCEPLQAYHLLIDYMAAADQYPVRPYLSTGSAACGGSVFSYLEKSANMVTACAGSYSSGKTERGELNVMIPGGSIRASVERLLERVAESGGASATRPGDPFPGLDVCGNCPLIKFKKLEKNH